MVSKPNGRSLPFGIAEGIGFVSHVLVHRHADNVTINCFLSAVEGNLVGTAKRSVGQMVKTPHFLCGIKGSIPLRSTK